MAFQTKIIQLVDRATREGWTPERFNTELERLMIELNIDAKDIEKNKKQLTDFLGQVNATYLGLITASEVDDMINYYKWKTIKTTENFKKKLSDSFKKHVNDINYNELRNEVKSLIGTKQYYANTILNTTLAGIDNGLQIATKASKFAKDTGQEPRFLYTGPPPERGFCRDRVGKVYKLSEIKQMNNGQGLPVLTNGGGYNCRHTWVLSYDKAESEK